MERGIPPQRNIGFLDLEKVVGVILVISGIMVIGGWVFGVSSLTNLIPSQVKTSPNGGITFIFLGVSLIMISGTSAWSRIITCLGIVLTGGIAVLNLIEYCTGWNLVIDQIFIREQILNPISPSGRIVLPGSICFILSAASLGLIIQRKEIRNRALVLAYLAFGITMVASSAMVFSMGGYKIDYSWERWISMSVHSQLLFLMVSAVIFLRAWRLSDTRWMISPSFTSAIVFLILSILGISGIAGRTTIALVQASESLKQAQYSISELNRLTGVMEEEQVEVHGYIITGDEAFLSLHESAAKEQRKIIRQLRDTRQLSATEESRLTEVEEQLAQWQRIGGEEVEARKSLGFEAAARIASSGRARKIMDHARKSIDEMIIENQRTVTRNGKEMQYVANIKLLFLPLSHDLLMVMIVLGVFRFNNEVSTRISVAEALEKSSRRFKMILEAGRIGEWELDLRTLKATRSLMHDQIFGYTEMLPEWSFEIFLQHVHPTDKERVKALFAKSLTIGNEWAFECRIIRHDGSDGWIWARGAMLRDETGQLLEMIGTVGDITDRRKAEEEIKSLNIRLQEHASDLQESIKELDAFSYSVSHDLRAPLRAIDGFSQILEEEYQSRIDEEGRRIIRVIRGESQRMGRLIDDLLTFSRLGRQKIEPVNVDMFSMARNVFEELEQLETGRKIHLDLHQIPPTYGTESMMRQVWVNLISNAIKFTKGREPAEIEINFNKGEDGRPVYYVRDNGVGFDMRYVDKLFGVFQRLHSADEFPGTGVGLSLVQRIIHRHGGHIWAEGVVGKGAVFYFTFPETHHHNTQGETT